MPAPDADVRNHFGGNCFAAETIKATYALLDHCRLPRQVGVDETVRELEVASLSAAFIADHDRNAKLGAKIPNIFFLCHIVEINPKLSHGPRRQHVSLRECGESLRDAREACKDQRLPAGSDLAAQQRP